MKKCFIGDIRLRYFGKCSECGLQFMSDTDVVYIDEFSKYCLHCGFKAEERRKAVSGFIHDEFRDY